MSHQRKDQPEQVAADQVDFLRLRTHMVRERERERERVRERERERRDALC